MGNLDGQTVGDRFVLHEIAGAGGMGAVYRATDKDSGAPVAVKLVLDAREDAVERFEREVAVLRELSHPSIVRYVGHGRLDSGEPYLAMEWLEGEDLAQRLERGRMSVDQATAVLARMAGALAAVHELGIVHRDVKPSNVFLRASLPEEAVLVDFGIARRATATRALTRTGHAIGTPQYMAPEQVRAEREIGPAADVFALGCVYYECLTGRCAFVGEHAMAVLAKILLEDPPPVSELVPAVPKAIDALLRSMLGKQASARPANCRELVERLSALPRAGDDDSHREPTELTTRERRAISVVLSRDAAGAADRTMTPRDLASAREALAEELRAFGGELSPIGSTHLVVTVPPTASAVDQATTAARCARVVASAMPHATVALAMGWAEVDPLPVGEVIDRAAAMVEKGRAGIHVDDESASLLELRFDLDGAMGARTLGAERTSAEPPRTLLGRPTPIVGRDRELGVVMGLVSEVVSDAVARVGLVTASAGVGKSRLRHELSARIERAHPEAKILVARAESFRSNASLDMIGQLVRDAAGVREGDEPARARAKILARTEHVRARGGDPSDVAAFLGEIASVPFEDAASSRLAAARRDNRQTGPLLVWSWLTWLESELEAHPTVLVFEDLHWADPQTVRYVDHALREHADRPLFVLALARPEVRTRFPGLWAERAVQEIALPPLAARAAEKLVRGVLSDLPTEEVERIVRHCEGNALYLEELIRAASTGSVADAPGTVLAMMQWRLHSLGAEERRVMRAASVFGEAFDVEDVGALVGGVEEARRALGVLVEREVMLRRRTDGEELAFRHALLREAAYTMLTPDDRKRAHALAAQRLEARAVVDFVVVADHYDLAGDPGRAGAAHAEAARQAVLRNEFEDGIARADTALSRTDALPVRARALSAKGRALTALGRWVEAEGALDEAMRLSEHLDPPRRIEVLESIWIVAIFRQDCPRMRAAAREALVIAEAADRPDFAAEAELALAVADHADGECERALARLRAALPVVSERPGLVVGYASITLYHAAAFEEAERVTRKMLGVVGELGDATTQVVLGSNLGLMLSGLGRYEDADGEFDRASALARKLGLTTLLARAVSTSAGYPLDVYDLDEATRRAESAREIGRAIEFATPRVSAAIDLAYIAARRGRVELAVSTLDGVRGAIHGGAGFHGWIWRGRLAVLEAELCLARGEWESALQLSSACVPGLEALRRVKYRLLAEHVRARALLALGRRDAAAEQARASLACAKTFPDPAMILRAAATVLEIERDEGARDALVEAAGTIERCLPNEMARQTFRAGAPLTPVG